MAGADDKIAHDGIILEQPYYEPPCDGFYLNNWPGFGRPVLCSVCGHRDIALFIEGVPFCDAHRGGPALGFVPEDVRWLRELANFHASKARAGIGNVDDWAGWAARLNSVADKIAAKFAAPE